MPKEKYITMGEAAEHKYHYWNDDCARLSLWDVLEWRLYKMESAMLVSRLESLAWEAAKDASKIDRHEICMMLVDIETWYEGLFGRCPSPDKLVSQEVVSGGLGTLLELAANHLRRAYLAHALGNVTHGSLCQSLRTAMCYLWNALLAMNHAALRAEKSLSKVA